MELNNFIQSVKALGITLTEKQLDQLDQYYQLLVEWNQKMNLTGITEKKDVYLKHFYDSLTLCKMIDLEKQESLCDIGTGAGFPGMVLKIVFPHLHVYLLDSLHKRLVFLEAVQKELGLEHLHIIESRAEEYAVKNREKFDVITCRAVAPLSILLEFSVPLVKIGGYFIPMKANVEEEKKGLSSIMNLLHISLEKEEVFSLPIEGSKRTLLKFKKMQQTSPTYPRKYSEMKKKPL